MHKKTLAPVGLLSLLAVVTPTLQAAEQAVAPAQVVTALEAVFGVTPGERRNHIKGSCAVGEFVGEKAAAVYTRSPLFSGQPVPVIARFSLSGGNPKAPDTAKSVRGMALQFQLPKGRLHQMALLNVPVFGAAQPQTFLDLMQALQPDPATGKADPEKMKVFKASHPDAQAQGQYMATHNPPVSYANATYWGIHTFKFLNKKSKESLVRWRFVPQDGDKQLTEEELKTAGANFLEQALMTRAEQGPVRWDMLLTIGQPGDAEDNPTLLWPEERQQIKVGTLSLSKVTPQKGGACEGINYDPLVMSDGVAASNDPVLQFRSAAYAVSYGKRLSGQ